MSHLFEEKWSVKKKRLFPVHREEIKDLDRKMNVHKLIGSFKIGLIFEDFAEKISQNHIYQLLKQKS